MDRATSTTKSLSNLEVKAKTETEGFEANADTEVNGSEAVAEAKTETMAQRAEAKSIIKAGTQPDIF